MALPVPRHRKLGLRRRADDTGGSDGQLTTRDEHSQSPSAASATTGRGASFGRSGSQVRDAVASARASPLSLNKNTSADHVTETDVILSGMQSTSDHLPTPQTVQIDDIPPSAPKSPSGPVIVSSSSAMRPASSVSTETKPPELGMEEHQSKGGSRISTPGNQNQSNQAQARQAGRGRGRGNNRGSVSSGFPPNYGTGSSYNTGNAASSGQWPHDMHKPTGDRRPRYMTGGDEGPYNGNGIVYRCKDSDTPINRTLSTERHVGNTQIRVFLPHMEEAIVFPAIPLKQYTKLPDHRPPLRQDKPVRISLPERAPRYIYPAMDRSFTFIPRAMRPNQQQRLRGRPRSNWGSVGGYSRRNSVFGGSHYGSVYTPSANHSRRSSVVFDREHMFSPTGSIISRPPMAMDNSRPVVRLPPGMHGGMDMHYGQNLMEGQPSHVSYANSVTSDGQSGGLPIYQPQPQKNISVADIDSPAVLQGNHAFQQAFHQQMPLQTQDAHGRRLSHSSQPGSGTPLSHLSDRGHHGTPLRQNIYQQQQQQQYYYTAGYPPQNYQADMYYQPMQYGDPTGQYSGYSMQHMAGPNMIAQEMNGMVYFYDPSQAQAQAQGGYGQRQYPNTPQMHGGMMYYPQ